MLNDSSHCLETRLSLVKAICSLLQDKKVTKANLSAVTSQQDILLDKLEEFEENNKVLRKMLKQAHKRVVSLYFTVHLCHVFSFVTFL